MDSPTWTETGTPGTVRLVWQETPDVAGVRRAVTAALTGHDRVEAWVPPEDEVAQRAVTWNGMRREGVRRSAAGDHVVYARLASDAPVTEPDGFRALLNSFLPRKRAIGQLLVRDTADRVLMCQLTYKEDWDLPGGVVEVGENPREGVAREVLEELGLTLPAGNLLLTDWMPPWRGWDDALCLVFDGGAHAPDVLDAAVLQQREIRSVAFLTLDEIAERAADFTVRRVRSALDGAGWSESGAPLPR